TNKRVEIVIIKPKDKKGISHYKSGVFSDSEDKVCFNSSCNFTAYGMLENLEQVNVDLEWKGESSYYRIASEENAFMGYFEKLDPNVDYIPVEEIEIAIQSEFGGK